MDSIVIRGARQNNLKNIDLDLPRGEVIAITGVSGSGKSSLAFDTIYAEGQRRYIESLSTYARQFLEKLEKPDVDAIYGISPTIAIKRKNSVKSARSTVGTATEVYDCLRLLFARIGKIYCPDCGIEVKSFQPGDVAREVIKEFEGKRIYVLMPSGLIEKDTWEKKRDYLVSRGFMRILTPEGSKRIEEFDGKGSYGEHLNVVIDRLIASEDKRTRIVEAVELAYRERQGMVEVIEAGSGSKLRFTDIPSCLSCGAVFEKPSPLLFSFNNPFGACPDCRGYGDRMEFSEELIVPDPGKSIREKAVDPWARERFEYFYVLLLDFCRKAGVPADIPFSRLPERDVRRIMEGGEGFIGVIPFLENMRKKSYKKGHRFFTRRYMSFTTCRTCRGRRLRREAYNVKLSGHSITDLNSMSPGEVLSVISGLKLSDREKKISNDLMNELTARLKFMIDVGLDYLTLDRVSKTLSGGEAQRINLANSMGANLVDTIYILDEPSVGLHAADNDKLIGVMNNLREMGNTVIVVEHDPSIILAGDYLVDLGPEPGSGGGKVMFSGYLEDAGKIDVPGSKTLKYIFKEPKRGFQPRKREMKGTIRLEGIREHNLKGIDVEIPLGNLVAITGVSGSGKSTLVVDVLYRLMKGKKLRGGIVDKFGIDGKLDRTLLVGQEPIGNTPRSNPVTYIKGFSYIREAFASQRKSVQRKYSPGRFSFNKPEGRCPRCKGMGYNRVEMHFMADIFVSCEECGGRRFNKETLEVTYRGKDISEVLDLTVDEAILFFDKYPKLGEKLWVLSEVGLGYLRLGQPSNTLSGGEAQRIKIAKEIAEAGGQRNLYIMDEPTTGLHVSDIGTLLKVFDRLLENGHTLLVIEHNLDVIRNADWVIDLGPGGGPDGGRVIASGRPEDIISCEDSKTGQYLRKSLDL